MYKNNMTCHCTENHSCSNMVSNYNDSMIDNSTCPYSKNMAGKECNECECGFEESNVFPSNVMYAQSYVPWQTINKTFIPCAGLKMGTIFPELVSSYMPGQSQDEINYIKMKNDIGMGCNKC